MAKISLTRIRKAAKAEIISHKKLLLVSCILSFIGLLLFSIGLQPDVEYSMKKETMLNFSIFLLAVLVLMGVIINSQIFRDLHSRQYSDMQLSLPLSSKERYFSKLLAVMGIHILPFIVFSLVLWLIPAVTYGFTEYLAGQYVFVVICFLSLSLFVDAVSVICTACCGAFAECVYIPVIVMGCISLMPILFYNKIITTFAGITQNFDNPFIFRVWTFSSCVLGIRGETNISAVFLQLLSCVISLAIMFAGYFIYRKRDGRSVGKPIVFKLFLDLFLFLGTFTIFVCIAFSESFWIGIIITLLISFIVRITVNRVKFSLKEVGIWLVKYAATVAVFAVITLIGYYTDGFGYANKALDEDVFKNNYVTMTVDVGEDSFYTWRTYSDYYGDELVNYDTANAYLDFIKSYRSEKVHSLFDYFEMMTPKKDEYSPSVLNTVEDGLTGDFYYYSTDNGPRLCIEINNGLGNVPSNYSSSKTYYMGFKISDDKIDEICEKLNVKPLKSYEWKNS